MFLDTADGVLAFSLPPTYTSCDTLLNTVSFTSLTRPGTCFPRSQTGLLDMPLELFLNVLHFLKLACADDDQLHDPTAAQERYTSSLRALSVVCKVLCRRVDTRLWRAYTLSDSAEPLLSAPGASFRAKAAEWQRRYRASIATVVRDRARASHVRTLTVEVSVSPSLWASSLGCIMRDLRLMLQSLPSLRVLRLVSSSRYHDVDVMGTHLAFPALSSMLLGLLRVAQLRKSDGAGLCGKAGGVSHLRELEVSMSALPSIYPFIGALRSSPSQCLHSSIEPSLKSFTIIDEPLLAPPSDAPRVRCSTRHHIHGIPILKGPVHHLLPLIRGASFERLALSSPDLQHDLAAYPASPIPSASLCATSQLEVSWHGSQSSRQPFYLPQTISSTFGLSLTSIQSLVIHGSLQWYFFCIESVLGAGRSGEKGNGLGMMPMLESLEWHITWPAYTADWNARAYMLPVFQNWMQGFAIAGAEADAGASGQMGVMGISGRFSRLLLVDRSKGRSSYLCIEHVERSGVFGSESDFRPSCSIPSSLLPSTAFLPEDSRNSVHLRPRCLPPTTVDDSESGLVSGSWIAHTSTDLDLAMHAKRPLPHHS